MVILLQWKSLEILFYFLEEQNSFLHPFPHADDISYLPLNFLKREKKVMVEPLRYSRRTSAASSYYESAFVERKAESELLGIHHYRSSVLSKLQH